MRTPLADVLWDAVAEATATDETGLTRRTLLRRAGVGAVGVAALGRLAPAARAASSPRIVVVGAGLAGLTCAYRLRQVGYVAQVLEASDRVGGRCWTLRGAFADGQIAEHGGELIDQGHNAIRNLAQELGLRLDNLLRAEANGTEMLARFDGKPYMYAEITDDIKQAWKAIHEDVSAASYPTLFDSFTQRGYELDQISIAEWIDARIPGGAGSRLGRLLNVAYNIEYGAETSEQSSLNLLYLLGYTGPGQFRTFGKSNEKYHVRGGNDQIATGLAAAVAGQVTTGAELVSVRRRSGGGYDLVFDVSAGRTVVATDVLVLALPFSILGSSVDLSRAGFSPRKLLAIRELGMGTNSKLHVQFRSRPWIRLGSNGETYADTGYQNTWEVTRAQPGGSGILVDYTGGLVGESFGKGTPEERAARFLTQLEPVLPGVSGEWNGLAAVDFWPGYEWTQGSYSYWKVGQYTAFAGVEGRQEGNAHFCGEHTSIDFQGYLNGAVETGERAAREVIADLG